jgi:hypothetical protein
MGLEVRGRRWATLKKIKLGAQGKNLTIEEKRKRDTDKSVTKLV